MAGDYRFFRSPRSDVSCPYALGWGVGGWWAVFGAFDNRKIVLLGEWERHVGYRLPWVFCEVFQPADLCLQQYVLYIYTNDGYRTVHYYCYDATSRPLSNRTETYKQQRTWITLGVNSTKSNNEFGSEFAEIKKKKQDSVWIKTKVTWSIFLHRLFLIRIVVARCKFDCTLFTHGCKIASQPSILRLKCATIHRKK